MNLLTPEKFWSRAEVLANPSAIPRGPGVYAWFFRTVPPNVPAEDCLEVDGHRLLYVGIAPKPPPKNGRPPSTQGLWDRVRYHYRGNAEGSTLRLSVGCLLSEELGIELRRVGSGKRMTFGKEGEGRLSEWLQHNAFVSWVIDLEPWKLEERLISDLSLPLNLDQNRDHPFHPVLSEIRKSAKQRARDFPILEAANK
jgi:hypothetical protein